jgi:hypothetical protein
LHWPNKTRQLASLIAGKSTSKQQERQVMIGFPLSTFKRSLSRVPAHRTKRPELTLNVVDAVGPDLLERLKDEYGDIGICALARRLPAAELLERLTFDQLCKMRYNQSAEMQKSVEQLFDNNPEYALVRKIESSMWRWGVGAGVWNEVVDAYDGMRNFKVPVDGFDVSLDFTTYYNERGYSSESRTYLDGVFGFLVHYKGEHVMTVGFSVMHGRRILVQQVQLARRKGNRFLFRLPANRVEFFLDCFASAFPRHVLCMADGSDIGDVSLQSYKANLDYVLCELEEKQEPRHLQAKVDLEARIAHLTADLPRLAAIYADTGRFKKGDQLNVNGVRHYRLAAAQQDARAGEKLD